MSRAPVDLDGGFSRFIETLARETTDIITPLFRPGVEVRIKADHSPVTEADRRAEERMRAMIRSRYPDHGLIGEEFGTESEDAEFVWTLDPIDGTISFASGCPLFGTLIGLLHQGQPVLGAIHQPLLGQFVIGNGVETRLNGRPARVREMHDLSRATLLTTDIKYIGKHQNPATFDLLVARTGLLRTWGDCYGYLLVATGRADIMLDPIMNTWDLVPLIPIIRGSGGSISAWDGGDPTRATSAVASSPSIHRQVLDILNGTELDR